MKKVLVFSLMTLLASVYAWGDANWTCGNVTVSLNTSTNTLTLSPVAESDGVMSDLTKAQDKWRTSSNASHVQIINIEDGVSYIGAYAFYYCLSITEIHIPSSVTAFGERAFEGSNGCKKIYYPGTPNDWAQIDFPISGGYAYSHPFYGSNTSNKFYFYGGTSATNAIVLMPGITEVKQCAFYNATGCSGINIPNSVTTIRSKAFAVYTYTSDAWIAINRKTAPNSVASDAFKTGKTIYVPSGKSGYTGSPWSSFTITEKAVTGTCGTPTAANVRWELHTDGTLELTGHGTIAEVASSSDFPWAEFRRLVHKIEINSDGEGTIDNITNALSWEWAITEVDINQAKIPSSTTSTGNVESNFNSIDNITLKINPAALASGDDLGNTPWTSAKFTTILSDDVTIDQDEDNTTLLNNIRSYVDEPFDMQLTRSLTNASYNTFCSPVPMSASEVSSIFGGAEIYELSNSSIEGNELTLTFADSRSDIEAGVPYLFKPTNTTANPTIENVDPASVVSTATSTSTEHLTFYGTLAPEAVSSAQIDDKSFIFLQAADQLTWANGGTIKGMRAYWLLDGSVPAPALLNRPILRIGNSTTGIETVNDEQTKMDGQKILRNGQLIIVRDGVEYNALGQIVK